MSHEKAVMINLSPEECMRIASGEQKAFFKKIRPNFNEPFKGYILCSKSGTRVFGNDKSFVTDNFSLLKSEKDFERTSGMGKWNGKVIGEFVCKDIYKITDCITHYQVQGWVEKELLDIIGDACSNYSSLYSYLAKKSAFAWYVSDLKLYDKPKAISDFCKPDYKSKCFGIWVWKQGSFLTQPPMSWCYVKDWFYSEN